MNDGCFRYRRPKVRSAATVRSESFASARARARRLAELYPESLHVQDVQLDAAFDDEIWQYARDNYFVIVSKDADFGQRSFAFGHPPKVIWIRLGNCTTSRVELMLREHADEIREFAEGAEDSFLALG